MPPKRLLWPSDNDDDDDLCEDDDFYGAFVQLRETGKEEEQTGGTGQFKINLNTHVEADFQGVPDSSIISACGHRYCHFIDLLILSLLQACPISPSRYFVFSTEKMYKGRVLEGGMFFWCTKYTRGAGGWGGLIRLAILTSTFYKPN